ncbi:MAG: STM3941 family protein [Terracidiphilus sp.]
MPTIEIRPKSLRNGILGIIGCSAFTICGAFMMASGKLPDIFAGLLSIVFFGGGGVYAIPKIMRRKISFRLTAEELQQIGPVGSAHIAWSDIEKIGIVSLFRNSLVGVRLKTYDNYIAGMSSDMADSFRKGMPALKAISRAASLLEMPYGSVIKVWSAFTGKDEPADVLKSFGKVGTYVEAMLWSREHYGYDVVWGWADRDRSAPEFAKLLEKYRAAEDS